MWRRILIVLVCLLGLTLNGYLWRPFLPYFFARANNDFACLYVGAVLAGSPGLYHADTIMRIQQRLGDSPQFLVFPRFPYYAALISPLRFLSYLHAYWLWQCVSLASVLVFLAFWPGQPRWVTAIACCWSLPLANCFVMGQDVTLVFAVLAVSLALFFRGWHFAAGCLIALCSIKFHLFVTLPLFVITRRLWRFGAGSVAGGAVLLAISFAVQGWRWPADWVRILRLPTTTPSYSLMPNLNGLLSSQPHSTGWMALAISVVLAAAGVVMWRSRLTIAIAAMLLSGLLLSYHAFIADAALLIPAGLLLLRDKSSLAHRTVGLILLSPLTFVAFRLENPPYPPATVILLSLLTMAAVTGRPAAYSPRRCPVPAAPAG